MAKAPTHHKYVKTQPSFEFASATDTHQNRVTTQNIRSKIQPINAHLKNPQPSPEPNMPRKSSIQQALSNNLIHVSAFHQTNGLPENNPKQISPHNAKPHPTQAQLKHKSKQNTPAASIPHKSSKTHTKQSQMVTIITHTNTKQHITNKYTGKHSLKLINLQSVFNTATTNRNQKHIRVTQPRSILTPKGVNQYSNQTITRNPNLSRPSNITTS
eukprot:gene3467-2418_t